MCEGSCYICKVPRVHSGLHVGSGIILLRVERGKSRERAAVKMYIFGEKFRRCPR
jgi:hypothetical protein